MPTYIKAGFWDKLRQGYKEWLNLDQFVESKIPQPKYKVYTALLTQGGGDNPLELVDGDAVTKGVTYLIDAAGQDTDFSNVGGPKYEGVPMNGTYFIATNDGIPNNYGGAVLLYNTGAPVVTVLENTIGNIWFTYYNPGTYTCKSNGLFTNVKSSVFLGETYWEEFPGFFASGFDGNSDCIIKSYNSSFDLSDGFLKNTFIEIRVYN